MWLYSGLSPVHIGNKVEFNMVDFCFGPIHTGDRVKRIGNKVDRDKLSNSSYCRFVAKTGNKVGRRFVSATKLTVSATGDCCRFVASFGNGRLSTKSTVLHSTSSPACTHNGTCFISDDIIAYSVLPSWPHSDA